MARQPLSNPLALPILALLRERPMHPYEMVTTIRQRHWHGSFKLTVGTLYTVVNSLQRAALIEAREVQRAGRRPERTIYSLTEAGRTALFDRLRALLSQPIPERTGFGAGLTLINVLPRAEAIELLQERERVLAERVAAERADLEQHLAAGLPRYLTLDADYAITLREAELAWLRQLIEDMTSGLLLAPLRGWSPAQMTSGPGRSSEGREDLSADRG